MSGAQQLELQVEVELSVTQYQKSIGRYDAKLCARMAQCVLEFTTLLAFLLCCPTHAQVVL